MQEKDEKTVEFRVITSLLRALRQHRKVIEQTFKDEGIYRSGHMILMDIAKAKTPPSQKELAQRREISPAAVAMCLGKLEKDGYIQRRPSDGDGRVKCIELTDLGKRTVENTRKRFDEIDRRMLAGFSAAEKELLVCMAVRMSENLLDLEAKEILI